MQNCTTVSLQADSQKTVNRMIQRISTEKKDGKEETGKS